MQNFQRELLVQAVGLDALQNFGIQQIDVTHQYDSSVVIEAPPNLLRFVHRK
ncbi:hypothetical protein D3C73_740360 [compost metagenome]